MCPDAYRLRRLRATDIADAMELKEAAGWNQTEEDWRLFLELAPDGCFALESRERVVATSTAVAYGRDFGWVGMVLVLPGERRRGHGTRMLLTAVEHLARQGVIAALDATPMGKPVYDRQGFEDVFPLERRVASAPLGRRPHPSCGPLDPSAVELVVELDRAAFGADRSPLLRGLLARPGSVGWVHRAAGRIDGYLIARRGTLFTHLGPWVASGEASASALWDTALARFGGETIGVDTPVPNVAARRLAEAAGLPVVRTLVRMARPPQGDRGIPRPPRGAVGSAPVPPGGRPDRVFALAGFAWG